MNEIKNEIKVSDLVLVQNQNFGDSLGIVYHVRDDTISIDPLGPLEGPANTVITRTPKDLKVLAHDVTRQNWAQRSSEIILELASYAVSWQEVASLVCQLLKKDKAH